MSVREQLIYWGLGLLVFILLLQVLADALTPFVLGVGIAYLTDPIASWMERRGIGRVLATIFITALSLAVVVVSILLVIPLVVEQVRDLARQAPVLIEEARELGAQLLPQFERDDSVLKRAMDTLRENAEGWSVSILKPPLVRWYGVDQLCRGHSW